MKQKQVIYVSANEDSWIIEQLYKSGYEIVFILGGEYDSL